MEVTSAEKLLSDAAEKAQQVVDKADLVAEALLRATTKSDEKMSKTIADALREVFSEPDSENPEHMKIIYSRIPILCIRVDTMDKNIQEIRNGIKWVVGLVLGGVILGILKVVIIG